LSSAHWLLSGDFKSELSSVHQTHAIPVKAHYRMSVQ
jgi:hypothetical protein